jgi:tetratricopeptide (TPR) repeat protein
MPAFVPAAAACLSCLTLVVLLSSTAQGVSFGTIPWQHAILDAQRQRDYGESPQAVQQLDKAWALAQQLGKDHPFYTITLRHLSDSNYRQYKFNASRKYALEELEILRKLGPDYQDIVPVLTRLAEIDIVEYKLDSAEKYMKEAQQIKDKAQFNTLGRADLAMRESVIQLAKGNESAYQLLRKRAEAELIATKVGKPGSTLSDYGLELRHLSDFCNKRMVRPLRKAALYYAERGLRVTQQTNEISLSLVHGYNKLSEIYDMDGRFQDKLECWKRGAVVVAQSPSMNLEEKATVTYMYGKPLVDQQRYAEAIPFLQQCVPYARKDGKLNVLADALFHLSFAYIKTNRFADAIATKRELVDVFEKIGWKSQANIQRNEIEKLSAAIK